MVVLPSDSSGLVRVECIHCTEFAQGMVLPTGTTTNHMNSSSSGQSTAGPSPSTSTESHVECSPAGSTATSGLHIPTRKLTGEEEFQCAAEDLYLALTEKERVEAFTKSVAQVDASPGGQFVLFGGNISGSFVELVRMGLMCEVVKKWHRWGHEWVKYRVWSLLRVVYSKYIIMQVCICYSSSSISYDDFDFAGSKHENSPAMEDERMARW